MRLFAFIFAGLLASAVASANGRAPGTSTINFKRGDDTHIAAGMTFGVVHSTDGGATWTWQCEEAVGYGGMYDPDYAFTSTGALFATTFDGLKVNRDSCTYERSVLIATDGPCFDGPDADTDPEDCNTGFTCATGLGGQGGDHICEKIKFFSATTVGPDGAVFAAAADPVDAKIYKSTDDGATFPIQPQPGQLMDWWQSIEVAPSNAQIVYLFGYRLANTTKSFLLFKSADGGATYNPLTGNGDSDGDVNGLITKSNSVIEIAAISKTNPNVVYARVTLSDNAVSDAIYRSSDGGGSWTKIIEKAGSLAFVARASGELVVGSQAVGTFKVLDPGAATPSATIAAGFTEVTGAPHINCLGENAAGVVFACTQNYGSPTVPKDDFGIMKTTDLTTWTGVLKFQDLIEPTACAAGSVQKDRCDAVLWCGLCSQLGCEANRDCAVVADAAQADGLVVDPPKKSCCQSGSDDIPGLLIICIAVSLVVLRRKRVGTS